MCVVAKNRQSVDIDHLGVSYDDSVQIMHEGIYMFGGVYGQSRHEKRVNNQLMLLPIGQDVEHKWTPVETSGIPPEGRYQHGMHYYGRGNYIVLFGGRKFSNLDEDPSEFVKEICLLKMDSLEWYEVYLKNKTFPEMYNFASTIVNDQIVIFGGMNQDYSYTNNLYSIELEKKKIIYRRPQ